MPRMRAVLCGVLHYIIYMHAFWLFINAVYNYTYTNKPMLLNLFYNKISHLSTTLIKKVKNFIYVVKIFTKILL